ncbi:hypothetical protein UFOVP1193_3 [uncultured Caudovirales phage]|jgi:hypothetical protein|uniref:Uncharacterized protein n=1 Tax=uncultured Caudovirales phage TaxID=2100421 RepID=A0A6J5QY12_9CAUD|nr:hypothetical protein UFOVP1193_3 [uncultured Caudovirales phage]
MSNDVLKFLSDKIQAERLLLAEDMSMGKAKDFGDYKYACGIIRGLLLANNMIIETAERLNNADD